MSALSLGAFSDNGLILVTYQNRLTVNLAVFTYSHALSCAQSSSAI
jgi:hypothetical protein